MSFRHFSALGGLSRRIYTAFLLAAVIPTALAGAIGVYLSLQALKAETLRNLEQEVTVRSQGIGRFFDQLSSELLYLANARGLEDVVAAKQSKNALLLKATTKRLERDYAALASLYPHVYQIRLIAADGQEWVRVDRKPSGIYVVPNTELQLKGDRYYFREAMEIPVGQIYVSPLDLNIEFGKVEKAILLKSPWNYAGWIQFYNAIKPRAEKGEVWVTNGRVNETWQSGFDDLRKP